MDMIRVLALVGDEADLALIRTYLQEIEHPVYKVDGIAGLDAGLKAIGQGLHDAYLVDQRLGARESLALAREAAGCAAPVFLLTRERSCEASREARDASAVDCLPLDALTADLLDFAIRSGIREKCTVSELQAVLEQPKQPRGIIPSCMYCHRLHSDSDGWQQPDAFVEQQTGASLSHGICPCCWKETVAPHLEELGCKDLEY